MRSTVISAVVCAFALGAAPAPAQESELGSARVAVIDMIGIYQSSQLGKEYEARKQKLAEDYNSVAAKKQAELKRLENELRQLNEDLQKQRNVLSPEGIEKKQQEIRAKERDYKAFGEDAQIELQRAQERARQQAQGLDAEFQQAIQPVIKQVAEELGIDILLDSQSALPINEAFDVTTRIVQKADADRPAAAAPPEGQP